MMTKESQNRTATRTRILDAAEQLLETGSSQTFKVLDVAKEAGVSASLIIQYFNSKDELVFEACLRRMGRIYPELFAGKGKSGVWPVLEAALQRDLQYAHMVVDLLSLSFRWGESGEARFQEALQPKLSAFRAGLHATHAGLSEGQLEAALQMTYDFYYAALRRACIAKSGPEAALGDLRSRLEPALRGIAGA